MSNMKSEISRIGRYVSAGLINTLVGFGAIVFLMWLGVDPVKSNIGGYAIGLSAAFLLSRRFVFGSEGSVTRQLPRFLLAFLVSFAFNLLTLKLLLASGQVIAAVAQVAATGIYCLVMYLLSKIFVFRD